MNQVWQALSISSPLKYLFSQNPFTGTIKGVFRHTIVLDIDNLLITVTDSGQGNLPFGILCDFSGTNPKDTLSVGENVVLSSTSIIVTNRSFEVLIPGADFWPPEFQLPIAKENISNINKNLKTIHQHVISKNILDGGVKLFNYLPDLVGDSQSDLSTQPILVQKMYASIALLFKALGIFNEEMVVPSCKNLAGLGLGLTPSVNDILTGLFGALLITLERILPGKNFRSSGKDCTSHPGVDQ